jgi:ABC-type multidrug transport system fused ATPase/permease subunit
LKQVSLKSYYADIGYLMQEPSVFDGTVRENLLYAVSEKISDADLGITMQLANCEFIYDLPQ